ncbi:hypothetical protein DSUL_60267 [Desulfovibrionales bacterium]
MLNWCSSLLKSAFKVTVPEVGVGCLVSLLKSVDALGEFSETYPVVSFFYIRGYGVGADSNIILAFMKTDKG